MNSSPMHDGITLIDGGITIVAGDTSALEVLSHLWWGFEMEPQLGCPFIQLVNEVVYSPLLRACPDSIDVAAVLQIHGDPPLNPAFPPGDDGAVLLYLEGRLHSLRCVDRFFRHHPNLEDWAPPAPGIEARSNEELLRVSDPEDEQAVIVIHQPELNAWAVPIPSLSLETQASLARTIQTAMVDALGEVVPASLTVELMTPVLYS